MFWKWFTLLAVLALLPPPVRAADSQYRLGLNLKLPVAGKLDLVTYAEFRANDSAATPYGMLLTEKAQFNLWKNLSLGINYAFLETDQRASASGVDEWQRQQRLEFEATPHWELPEGLALSVRNRLELRWVENRTDMNHRSRHRLQLTRSIPSARPLQGLFADYEFFYDWEKARNTEHRLTPLGLNFRLGGPAGLRVYYLWQHAETRTGWLTTHNLYTVLDVTFK